MSPITHLTQNAIAVKLNEGVGFYAVCQNNHLHSSEQNEKPYEFTLPLPPGPWSILRMSDKLTEDEWKKVVEYKESLPFTDFANKKGTPCYSNYEKPLFLPQNFNEPIGHELVLDTATESGLSLLKSKGIKTPQLILIKNE